MKLKGDLAEEYANETIKKKTKRLFEKYNASPCRKTRDEIITLNLKLVYKIVYRSFPDTKVPFEDLIQIGSIGLIQAVDKYQPEKGAFSSYACPWIRGEIRHYLRDRASMIRVDRASYSLKYKKSKVEDQLSKDIGEIPGTEEVIQVLSKECKMTESEVRRRLSWLHYADALNGSDLDMIANSGSTLEGFYNVTGNNEIHATPWMSPQNQRGIIGWINDSKVMNADLFERVIESLSENEQRLLKALVLDQLTKKQYAQDIGVAWVTVHRQYNAAVKKLKDYWR